ncbi:MAG: endonuclease/exonuclease/phosphatase family protein [Candidatus Kariarchaeaceae archaeon]|jgi:endonuclease/exonuclease/phosphatase family metal-dependent hydrolase
MNFRMALGFLLGASLLIGISPIFTPDMTLPENTGDLRVMNFNTHFGIELDKGYDLDGFIEQIEQVNAHVVAFQELTLNSPLNGFANMYGDFVLRMDKIGYTHSYLSQYDGAYLKNAVFSKLPFTSADTIYYTHNNAYIRSFLDVRVDYKSESYAVLVTHLTHITGESTMPSGETVNVRVSQTQELVDYAAGLSGVHVMALGDYNFEPHSDSYNVSATYFGDAWVISNPGDPGFTFPSDEALSGKRIDYILVGPSISVTSCDVYDTTVSDHKPIACDLAGN